VDARVAEALVAAPPPTPSTFDKYYDVPEVDPEWNQGRYLPRHCLFWGEYEGVIYDEVPMEEVPFKKEHVKEFYSDSEILDFVDNPEGGTQKPHGGHVGCEADWEMSTHLETNMWKGETAPRDLYGVSFYSRIFDFYPLWPTYQSGIWGQWIQSPNSHPYSAISSIEGGLGAYQKFGRSLYPKYMANSATHFYNPNSSLFGWGFYERRVDCAFYGGIQITNKVLSTPNLIAFDENQNTYEDDGGIFFGHGWFALPILDGKERNANVDTTGPKSRHENTIESGKLTWTFFIESDQYAGPMWGYVPEYWYRRLDRWNSLEVLGYFWEQMEAGEIVSVSDLKVMDLLKDYLGGREDIDTVMSVITTQDWYVDDVDSYDYERAGPFWVQAKNTFGFNAAEGVAIGAEQPTLPVFTEYDETGTLYIKVYAPIIPSLQEQEPFTLDGKTYDSRLYNYFVDFFNGKTKINELNTNLGRFANPLQDDGIESIHKNAAELYASSAGERNPEEYPNSVSIHWNMPIVVDEVNSEITTYFDWGNLAKDERKWNTYYKVETAEKLENYKFKAVDESEVPAKLRQLEAHDNRYTISIMPHVTTDQDKSILERVKNNTDELLGIDSHPGDYSCWNEQDDDKYDPVVYESTLDDGSKVKYRWYRFINQPTFQQLIIDYPKIYTSEYLSQLQQRIEEIHGEWGTDQSFLNTPTSLTNVHLVELDSGLMVDPPIGKEIGWVPIVLEVEMPYGKWKTELDFLEMQNGIGSITDY
jgi:hypothetical protein